MNKDRYLVVVSAPSGCGKDTVVGTMRAKHPEIALSVSATSRPPRGEEQEGVHYYFLTEEQFMDKVEADEMAEYARYGSKLYGTPRSEIEPRMEQGQTVVLIIEVQGAARIRARYPGALTVFLMPPSMEVLEARLRGRGTDSEESIQKRLAEARTEMEQAPLYTATLVNDDLQVCADELYRLICEHQSK